MKIPVVAEPINRHATGQVRSKTNFFMNIDDLKEKLIAVLGYGQEGRAVTRYLMKHGISPVLFDQRPWNEWPTDEQQKIKQLNLNFIFGPDAFMELAGFDVAFRSPGIPISKIQTPPLRRGFGGQAKSKCQITSQTKFFFDNCPSKIIGVTGTKGKGTTATLISEILKSQAISYKLKAKSYLTGNIGKVQPLDILDNLKKDDWVIYELSSFQLQDLDKSPHIGVVLMITQEHLDYHKNNNEYIDAKSAITKFQTGSDFAIINVDYSASIKIGELGQGKKLYFSRKNNNPKIDGRQKLDFQTIGPDLFVKDGQIINQRGDFIFFIADLQLRGEHNLENVCAAILAARAAEVNDKAIKQATINFKGLEHRLEFVGEKHGIKFYNDSFSTTPETAIAAIKSFTEPLIVILGGSSKNSDFRELGKIVEETANIKSVILVGEESPRIKLAMSKFKGAVLEGSKSMAEIFAQVKSMATEGDIVLLSPACASFDMFKDYKDRGTQFNNYVKNF